MTPAPRKPLFSSGYQLDILICLGLVLAIFIPYRQVAGHQFIEFDDNLYTFNNVHIIRGLCWDSICWAFTSTEIANWHPLTWISHLVDRELFGPYPGGYFLANVAWHALAACLCYVAFLKGTGSRVFAFTVALVFAVHPVNVENVAWASERKSILNAVFWFAAIIAYLSFLRTRSFRSYGLTIIFHLLSLLSKPMSVTLPGTLVLIHLLYLIYHPEGQETTPSRLRYVQKILLPVLPLLALSLYFSVVTMSTQSLAMATAGYTLGHRLINVLLSYERYLAMFFHPTGLAPFYPLFFSDLTFASAIPPLLLLAAISALVLALVRKKPQLLLGWCWFLGTMVPAIGLVQVGSQSHADRYLYIPMLGLAFVFPVLFEALASLPARARRIVIGGSLAVLSLSLVLATQIQVSYWQSGVTLFQHSLAITGDCVTSVIDLEAAYVRAGRFDEAIAFADLKIASAKNPANQGKLTAWKATVLYNLKKFKPAMETAEKALAYGNTESLTYMILAMSNHELGHLDKVPQYIAKARAAHKVMFPSGFIEGLFDAQMRQLENELQAEESKKNAHPPSSTPAVIDEPVIGTKPDILPQHL